VESVSVLRPADKAIPRVRKMQGAHLIQRDAMRPSR
jgi:hypothetical protein